MDLSIESVGGKLIATAIAAVLVTALRWLVARVFMRSIDDLEVRRRWLVLLRNLALMLLFLTVVVIWAEELRTFIVSIVALAAAIAIAGKELIMCLTGALVRASRPSFRLGDRVEIAGVRGDVIDHRLLTTTLLEVGPGHAKTGKVIVLPNSIFLANTVVNETTGSEYLLHSMTVSVATPSEVAAAEAALLRIGAELTEPYQDAARREFEARSQRLGLAIPTVEPHAAVQLDGEKAQVTLRVAVPSREKGRIEQAILHRWLEVSGSLVDTQG